MFKCVLIADDVQLDLSDNLPLSVNLSIAEIQDFSKRHGDFSKTIKLPGTKINNDFFEHTYDVNIKTSNWNPNVKVPAQFREGGDSPLIGDLRLLSIDVKTVNGIEDISYDVVILGRNDTLFKAIADDKLEVLNFSTYNHTFNYAKQNATESNTCDIATVPTVCANGVGYRYPLVDYGYNGFASNYYHVNHLRPAFFEIEYWRKIFTAAGKTFTSVFLNDVNDLPCRTLVLHNGEKLTMTPATLANRECYVGDDGTSAAQTKNLTALGSSFNDWWSGDIFNSLSNTYLMKFNDETTLPFVDTGNIHNPATGIITLGAAGSYNLSFNANFQIKFTAVPAGTVTINPSVNTTWAVAYKVLRSTDGGSTWTIYSQTNNFQSTLISTSYQTFNKIINVSGSFNSADQFKLLIHPLYSPSGYGIVFKDSGGTPITVGTATMAWRLIVTATLSCKLPSSDITEGMPIVVNDAIPKDIKQKDFIMHCIKKYNLYVDVDKADPNNYIIEPRDDFYAAGSEKDWTRKWAVDKDITIKPMGDIDWKTFTQSYKQDQDFYNKQYQDSYQEAYGTSREILTNDFNSKELKDELIFSPTPVVNNPYNDLIIPKIFSFDGTTVKPMKHNIRTVLWRGSVAMTNTWTYGSTSGNVTKSSYQGCAMVDDPLNSMESIEFGIPNQLYYSGISLAYTNNNLFGRFYSSQITQLTHRDSKTVTMFMKLEPSDIANFDFRDKIWVKDSWYYVNKIIDYNPIKEDLTKVEFLKIVSADTFVPVSESVSTISTSRGFVGMSVMPFGMPVESLGPMSSNRIGVGTNNSSESEGGLISGDGNRIGINSETSDIIGSKDSAIGNECRNVFLVNCLNCHVGDFAEDVRLENCVNYTVGEGVRGFSASFKSNETIDTTSDGTSREGNTKGNVAIRSLTKTASFNIDPEVGMYYIDCTAGNIVATYDFTTDANRVINFKRIDSSVNTFSIDEVISAAVVDGAATPYNTYLSQFENITIDNDGTDFFIQNQQPKYGNYTPALTNGTNVAASTAVSCQYSKVGRVVTVSGSVDIDPTAAGAFELGIALPFASNLGQLYHCAGNATSVTNTDTPCYVKGDTANDRASLNGNAVDTSNHTYYFHFTYRII